MAKMNKKQATITGIEACGLTRTFRSNRYRTYDCYCEDTGERLYTLLVGKSGALRVLSGRRGNDLSLSISITGTLCHASYEYIGRICESSQLSAEQSEQIRIGYTNGVIAAC